MALLPPTTLLSATPQPVRRVAATHTDTGRAGVCSTVQRGSRVWSPPKPPRQPAGPSFFHCFDRLAVQHRSARFRLSPRCTAHFHSERIGAPRPSVFYSTSNHRL